MRKRKYTAAERCEVEKIRRAGFTGQGNLDLHRAEQLMKISPDEYREIGDRVRKQEVNRLRSF